MRKNNMKHNINIYMIIWVTGLFLLLIIILLMVMDYKINYQYLTKNYIYFYDCDGSVCTARVKDGISQDKLYSVYSCEYDNCPTIKKVVNENYVILSKDNKNILYNFMEQKVISDSYEDYQVLSDKYIIVIQNNYKGMIDNDNNIIISTLYDDIGYYKDGVLIGYNLKNIIVKKNNLYGIVSMEDGKIVEKVEYKEEEVEELLNIINS